MSTEQDFNFDEAVHATAANILLDEGKLDALHLLLSCKLSLHYSDSFGDVTVYSGVLSGTYLIVKELRSTGPYYANHASPVAPDEDEPIGAPWDIVRAIMAAMPIDAALNFIQFLVDLQKPDENWKEKLLEAIRGGDVSNQGKGYNNESSIRVYEGLRYRSMSEVKIAEALERAGVMYFPNCSARLGKGTRYTREPDFLIFHNGKWGILEVDGEPYHPPSRTVQDHARDRLFLEQGKIFIQHYDSKDCFNNPTGVVSQFIKLLAQS
jgi:hypothetical protein